jgi:hypothetical protein
MTKKEEEEFLNLIDCGDGNHYTFLGLMPFSEFNTDTFNKRINYLKMEVTDSIIRNDGLKYLFTAKAILSNKLRKTSYDFQLKKKLKRKLILLIEFAISTSNTLTLIELEKLDVFGNRLGFSAQEVFEIIEEQRKKYHFNDSIS